MSVFEPDAYDSIMEIQADLDRLPGVVEFTRHFFRTVLPSRSEEQLIYNLQLVVSEACANIMKYAYPAKCPGILRLELYGRQGMLAIRITDKGCPFDPGTVPDPDLDQPSESGLGVFFLRELMDAMHYRREDGCNVLVLNKKL